MKIAILTCKLKPSNDSTVTNVTGKLIIQINAKPIANNNNNMQSQAPVSQVTASPSQSSQISTTKPQFAPQTSNPANQSFVATPSTQNSIYQNPVVSNQPLYTVAGAPANFQRPVIINNNGLPPG